MKRHEAFLWFFAGYGAVAVVTDFIEWAIRR